MCINWKVVGSAGAVGLGVFLFAPSLIGVSLPFLVMAVCPLSMVLMMRRMGGGAEPARAASAPPSGNRQMADLEDEVHRLRAELRLRDERASS